MSKNFLSKNEQLLKDQFLISNNGKYKAIFQGDGNFVVYGDKVVWATGTDGSDAVRVIMQADGNLVMYNQSDQPKWSSGTYIQGTCDKCRVELTDGGKLELTRTVTEKVWSS
ncbi:hypothetical protein PFLUV_G00257480 [Perca fluviatilis]|uniref:Bulb-type lectin domain-containing protein n=1 Tax=Perca fluviatilis TaxID=8168 RepID=A0A6A5E276_PERFL|nr:mannose-specific lectin-like [Perca fluviatilis]KAF1373165.1 hypothetical protein PFLUV_G00257480 [Perca fluviatilis]